METSEQIIKIINDFPPMPKVALKLLNMIKDENSTPASLAKVAELDQVLAAKILKVSNSAYYGLKQKIGSIPHAISILGEDTLSNIIYVSSVPSHFVKEIKSYHLKKGELWKHSVATAFAAKHLCEKLKYQDKEKAFTVGLLHDIGKIVMDSLGKDNKEQIDRWIEEGCPNFLKFEKEIFGIDHQTAGAKIAEAWNFPEDIVDAIQNHHKPANSKFDYQLTASIHLADFTCTMIGITGGIRSDVYQPDFTIFDRFNLNIAALEQYEEQIYGALINIEEFLDI